MSEISADEKKRILRERRAAKLAKGGARLNKIVNQGSSIKVDEEVTSTVPEVVTPASHQPELQVNSTPQRIIDPDADPEILEIPSTENIEEIFNKVFAGNNPAGAEGGAPDDFSKLLSGMLGMQDGASPFGGPDSPFGGPNSPFGGANSPFGGADSPFGAGIDPAQAQYQQELTNYNQYQQKLWKFRFLVIRTLVVLSNFFYHFVTISDDSFSASSYSYVRGLLPATPVGSFFTLFTTAEVVILATFYIVSSQKDLFKTKSDNSLILKGLGFVSMVLPQINAYRPLIVRLLGYYELLSMLLGDLSLVVVLFGLLSFIRR